MGKKANQSRKALQKRTKRFAKHNLKFTNYSDYFSFEEFPIPLSPDEFQNRRIANIQSSELPPFQVSFILPHEEQETTAVFTEVNRKIKSKNVIPTFVSCFLKLLDQYSNFFSTQEWSEISVEKNKWIQWKRRDNQRNKFNLQHLIRFFSTCSTSKINRYLFADMIRNDRLYRHIFQNPQNNAQNKKKIISMIIAKVYAHRCRNRSLVRRVQVRQ